MWLYKNKIINKIEDFESGTFGYIYRITNLITGKEYIGKKQLESKTNIILLMPSNGSFWYGKCINFPGFLYKKNNGVGVKRSTQFTPGGNTICNQPTYLYNWYIPGSGVGASNISVRRHKKIRIRKI